MLDRKEIEAGLRTTRIGRSLHVFDSIGSTNAVARSLAEEGAADGTVVLAEHQTAGRGRLGRSWIARPGENLLLSVLLRPLLPAPRLPLLTFCASLAAADAVASVTGLRPAVKWPNDLLLNDRKFCGILLESALGPTEPSWTVIGIGINVNQHDFPDDLRSPATSLANETGATVDRIALCCSLLGALEHWEQCLRHEGSATVVDAWRSRSRMFGRQVSVLQGETRREGIAQDLAADGGLIIRFATGVETVHAGDVSLTMPFAPSGGV